MMLLVTLCGIGLFRANSAWSSPLTVKQAPPNIVFILVDDLGWSDVGCYNRDTPYETPQVDRLAAQGMRFTEFYAAMVQHMDENIGRMLIRIRELALEENTIVVFTSDNGGKGSVTSNSPLKGAKHDLNEGGIRVPLIVKWPPRIKAGTRCDYPLISNDFYPTLLDLADCSLEPEQHRDGISFQNILLGQKKVLDREALYWHYPHSRMEGAVRKGDFKLIYFYKKDKTELYNLKDDIGETRDLSGDYPEVTQDLLNKLKNWQQRVGAQF
jgi:arylsulfatase A-like enzyme